MSFALVLCSTYNKKNVKPTKKPKRDNRETQNDVILLE